MKLDDVSTNQDFAGMADSREGIGSTAHIAPVVKPRDTCSTFTTVQQ